MTCDDTHKHGEARNWRMVPGFEGVYCASEDGQVWSNRRGRMLRLSVAGRGYLRFGLSIGPGRTTSAYVHRFVALAFHGEPGAGEEVRHLDGDPTNNHASNLAWGSHVENMADQWKHGTRKWNTHCRQGHAYTEANTGWNYSRNRLPFRVCRACANASARRQRADRRTTA
jgi:hypothetical protein